MKKFLISVLTILVTILFLAGAAVGIWAYRKYSPSRTLADPSTWFHASGDEVAIVLNDQLVENEQGRLIGGQVYLPLTWVNNYLNERFYWSEEDHQLIYALPESIVYADEATMGSSGSPLFVEKDDEVWLLTDLVLAYTDARMECFVEDETKRVYVDTLWEPVSVARVKKSGQVRVLGGVKSDILTPVEADEQVEILESLEKWVKVRTTSGYIGYMQKKLLDETRSEARISSFQAPVYSSIALDEPVSMVWHQVTSKAANDQMENLMANTKGVNVIAPTWFMLTDNEGNFDCLCDSSYVSKAHNMGLQVWAVLDNFNRGDEVKSEVLFASTKARRKLIAALMEEVLQNDIDGINIDIEGIKPSAGKHYIQFIRELSVSCRKNGIILSVDSYVPSAYTAFYNRAEQGCVADYVVIMGYDEHYAGGEAGSVASLGYERQGIEDTLADVPAQKIISAIPLYTRVWKVDSSGTSSTAMGLSGAQKWVADNGVELYWQEDLGQYYGEKQMNGSTYYIWMEDERSLQLKMNLIHQYQLAGVACWKLGFDTADIWDTIQP
jgi:spore germination protein YaaH